MTTRISDPVVRRASLSLTEQNELDLSLIRESSSHQIALERLSDIKMIMGKVSEAVILHAIFEIGIAAVRQKAELVGYAEMASSLSEGELQQHRYQSRRRRPSGRQDE